MDSSAAVSHIGYPSWSLAPFAVMVSAIAIGPVIAPRAWLRLRFPAALTGLCAAPVVACTVALGGLGELAAAARSWSVFVATLGALYIAASGVRVSGELPPTPRTNVLFLLMGSVLASLIGTTGASMLLIRPFLRTNRRRRKQAHLVVLFVMAVANAGGLLTPIGNPPLLMGYVAGVPFLWTLRLLPAWLIYVGSLALLLLILERRAVASEAAGTLDPAPNCEPVRVQGWLHVALVALVVPASLLPSGSRLVALSAIGAAAWVLRPRDTSAAGDFSLAPLAEVAVLFAGVFVCLVPVQAMLADVAPRLPIGSAWELFWASGLTSSVLDNAPTYAAFFALAKGLAHTGAPDLVAGVAPIQLAALSVGSMVMGGMTYIGNGPNLMIKAIAERERFPVPSFAAYTKQAFVLMLPANLTMSLLLALLERH